MEEVAFFVFAAATEGAGASSDMAVRALVTIATDSALKVAAHSSDWTALQNQSESDLIELSDATVCGPLWLSCLSTLALRRTRHALNPAQLQRPGPQLGQAGQRL